MWNCDEHGLPILTCSKCPGVGPQLAPLRRNFGCPKEGAKGEAKTGEHPLSTCPGWYWEQGATWQIRDVRDSVQFLGDLDNKSNLIIEIALKFKHFRAWKSAKEREAEARRLAKEAAANGSTR